MLAIIMICLQSCYQYRVSSANFDPGDEYSKPQRVNSYLWGKIQNRKNGIDLVADDCDSLNINKMDEVLISTNFIYSLINVVTLGIWCPINIQYKCSKPCQRIGTIPNK